jgi:outer membrane protein assembly factor BamB
MNPANGSISTPLQFAEPGGDVTIALAASSVWVADSRDPALVELDPVSLDERRRVPLSATVSAISPDGTILWVLDSEAGELFRIDTAGQGTVQTLPIAGSALLVHGGWVWVAGEDGTLVRLDPANGAERGRVEIGIEAEQLVGSVASILGVASGKPAVRIGIDSLRVESRGVTVLAAASQGDQVWALLPSGHLVRLSPDRLQPVAATAIELEATGGLALGGGWLWTTGSDASGTALLKYVTTSD